jgi:flagellar motor switch protein FliG
MNSAKECLTDMMKAVIQSKIKSNISERAATMVDEEASLMSSPRREEIEQARETIVNIMREMVKTDKLNFVEEE